MCAVMCCATCCAVMCTCCVSVQVVKLGDATPTFTVYPMPGARHVQVPIYATEASTASHVTEKGMQAMGVIEVRATCDNQKTTLSGAAARHSTTCDIGRIVCC
jgi:hypothetical protein